MSLSPYTHIAAALVAATISWKVTSWAYEASEAKLNVELTAAHSSLHTLTDALDRQNKGVELLASDGKARTEAANAAVIHIQPELQGLHKDAADILARSQKGDDACKAADELILESVQ